MMYKGYIIPTEEPDKSIYIAYIDILRRLPDPRGFQKYCDTVRNHELSIIDVRSILTQSVEYKNLMEIDKLQSKVEEKKKELKNQVSRTQEHTPEKIFENPTEKNRESINADILFLCYVTCPRVIKEYLILERSGFDITLGYFKDSEYTQFASKKTHFEYTPNGIKKLIEKVKPNKIHCHNMPDEGTVWARDCFSGIIIHDIHDYWNYKKQESVFESAINKSDYVYTVNEDFAKFLEEKYKKHVYVSHSSLPSNYTRKMEKLSSKDGKVHICFIGSLYNIDVAKGTCERLSMLALKEKIHIHLHVPYFRDTILNYVNEFFHLEEKLDLLTIPFTLSQYDAGLITTHGDEKLKSYEEQDVVYKLSLPNKFFDYVDSEIPIISESGRDLCNNLISKYEMGLSLDKIEDLKSSHFPLKYNKSCFHKKYVSDLPPYRCSKVHASPDESNDIVIICNENTSGVVSNLSNAINKYTPYTCRWVERLKTKMNLDSDLTFDSKELPNILKYSNAFHWNIFSYKYFKHNKIYDFAPYLNGKTQTKHYHGSDLRNKGNRYLTGNAEDSFLNCTFCSTPDLVKYTCKGVYLPNPTSDIGIEDIVYSSPKMIYHNPSSNLKISQYYPYMRNLGFYLQFPDNADIKGTSEISRVAEELNKTENLSIVIDQPNTPYSKSIDNKKKCSFYIDQIWIGVYGMSAIEAMSLKKGVMCRIDKEFVPIYKRWIDDEIPMLPINIGSMKEDILHNSKLDEKEIGNYSFDWCKKFHNNRTISKIFTEIVMEGERYDSEW